MVVALRTLDAHSKKCLGNVFRKLERVAETLIELTLEKSSAEVGQETTILCKVSKPGSFEGNAKCKLMGLPVHVDSQEVALSADVKELIFPVVISVVAPGYLLAFFVVAMGIEYQING